MVTEADTCRKYVLPSIYAAGWKNDQIGEQFSFTEGQILVNGRRAQRGTPKRADYLLRYKGNYTLAVIEAKAEDLPALQGMQQAKQYAEILGLLFAYATNGLEIMEFDFSTGIEQHVDLYPSPSELWNRYRLAKGLGEELEDKLLIGNYVSSKIPRYYQQIAINRAIEAILSGKQRILLTLATGTGKTVIAFQIAWRLWTAEWNRAGKLGKRPRILFLADRSVLIDDPKDKDFAPFDKARLKIEHGIANKSREMYFADYQAIAEDINRLGLYKEYAPDFFDLIIVDEAHRGSARDDSSWRKILEYYASAIQLGMTATPKRDDSIDTYDYFGNPIYTYSLKQGIQDGFLAPYQVRRIVTDIDATGFRPYQGQLDDFGREIPDREYSSPDFEAKLSLKNRTKAVAQHLTNYLKQTNRFDKTIVFCHDQEHADQMRQELSNANADIVQQHSNYVVRITANDGDIGKGFLSDFQDIENQIPTIVTTSRLLSTGVDVPMVKNVVLFRTVTTMTEFKQIIGRGTRVREDYGKLFFSILDYTGSASKNFADTAFDGEPALITEITIDGSGNTESEVDTEAQQIEGELAEQEEGQINATQVPPYLKWDQKRKEPRKFYLSNGVQIEIIHEQVQELDVSGHKLRTVQFTTYAGEQVRSLYPDPEALRGDWIASERRLEIIRQLANCGVTLEYLMEFVQQPDVDPFDLLCHFAFNTPLHTRKERANRLLKEQRGFFTRFAPQARQILEAILEQYAEYGPTEISLPKVLYMPQIAQQRTINDISELFGGAEKLRNAVIELQKLLYAA